MSKRRSRPASEWVVLPGGAVTRRVPAKTRVTLAYGQNAYGGYDVPEEGLQIALLEQKLNGVGLTDKMLLDARQVFIPKTLLKTLLAHEKKQAEQP